MAEETICKHCGSRVDSGSRFCTECGSPVLTEPPYVERSMVPESTIFDREKPFRARSANEKFCTQCGELIFANAEICPKCGVRQISRTQVRYEKDRVTAGVLAILLGGIGIHKFYLGKTGEGLIYLCFFWTIIPAIVGFIEGILYLTKSDEEFQARYVPIKNY